MDVRRGALITILGGCLCATGLQSIATPPVAVASIADDESWSMPATVDDPAIFDEISAALATIGYPR